MAELLYVLLNRTFGVDSVSGRGGSCRALTNLARSETSTKA